MKNQTQSLIGIGVLLQNSWQVYKKEFRVFLGVLVPVFVMTIVGGFVAYLQSPIIGGLLTAIGGIVNLIVSFWIGISLLYVMKDREVGIGAKEALQKGWRRLLSYWWITVLVIVITMGGFFLLIIPGIILSIWFSFAAYVLVAEDKRGMTALLRSKHLVSGYWWGVFWRFLAVGLVGLLVMLPLILLEIGLGSDAVFPDWFGGEQQIVESIEGIVRIPFVFVQWLFSAFVAAYAYLVYENLRNIKSSTPFEEPSRGTKIKYLLVGIFGIVAFLAMFVLLMLLFIFSNVAPEFREAYESGRFVALDANKGQQ